MISHFQVKQIHSSKLFGWALSFFYAGKKREVTYHRDGRIEWLQNPSISNEEKGQIEKAIHELMLFHVYDGS